MKLSCSGCKVICRILKKKRLCRNWLYSFQVHKGFSLLPWGKLINYGWQIFTCVEKLFLGVLCLDVKVDTGYSRFNCFCQKSSGSKMVIVFTFHKGSRRVMHYSWLVTDSPELKMRIFTLNQDSGVEMWLFEGNQTLKICLLQWAVQIWMPVMSGP